MAPCHITLDIATGKGGSGARRGLSEEVQIFILLFQSQAEFKNSEVDQNVSSLGNSIPAKAMTSDLVKDSHFRTFKYLGRSRGKKGPLQEKMAFNGHVIFPATVFRQND